MLPLLDSTTTIVTASNGLPYWYFHEFGALSGTTLSSVDPHARHTTTNMRNAAREIYRYGIPMSKPALVVSDSAQVSYIASQPFADRCLKELGYVPYQIVKRASDTSLVFLPRMDSLQQDPLEPLDP